MLKAIAYLRTLTTDQFTANQTPAIEAWAKANDVQLEDVIAESESAWHEGHQKELAKLLKAIRAGQKKYDFLIVWSLDRLTRQGIGAMLQLINTLKVHGCRVISIQESFTQGDSSTSELMYALIAWLAKFESDRRSQRIRAGLARVKITGTKSGVGVGKRGQDKNPDGRRKSGYYHRWMGKKTSDSSYTQTADIARSE